MPRNRKSNKERFETLYVVEPSTGCWLWSVKSRSRRGYGLFTIWEEDPPSFYQGAPRTGRWRTVSAHRFAYMTLVGPIPEGLTLDHVKARGCLGPACVNPAHLEPVTMLENIRRGGNTQKTHCPRGHAYDESNIYRGADGSRQCQACTLIRSDKIPRKTERRKKVKKRDRDRAMDQARAYQLMVAGKGNHAIATELGLSQTTILNWRLELGLPPRRRGRPKKIVP